MYLIPDPPFPQAWLNIPGCLTRAEREWLSSKVREWCGPGSTIVEIGAYMGASTGCLLNGIRWTDNAHLYTIDSWGNSAEQRFWKALKAYEVETNKHTLIRGDSTDPKIVSQIPEVIDFLFIDGNHDTEIVLQDLKNYTPRIPVGGIVALHDARMPVHPSEIPDQIERVDRLPQLVLQISVAIDEWLQEWASSPSIYWGELTSAHTIRAFDRCKLPEGE